MWSNTFVFSRLVVGSFWNQCRHLGNICTHPMGFSDFLVIIWTADEYVIIRICNRLSNCREDIGNPWQYLGQNMGVCHYKDFVIFRYYWEHFGTCVIVRARDEDAITEILFCFLSLWKYFAFYHCLEYLRVHTIVGVTYEYVLIGIVVTHAIVWMILKIRAIFLSNM